RSLRYHTKTTVGDSLARITGDCWCVNGLADALLLTPIQSIVMIVAMAIIMARMDPWLTIVALIVAPLMVVLLFKLRASIHAAAHSKREVDVRIQSHVQQMLTGIAVVQAFGQEQRERDRFDGF